MRTDEFFYKQPEPEFISWLNSPMHESKPENFTKTAPDVGEISVTGAYVAEVYGEWKEIIATATDDLTSFLSSSEMLGNKYPIKITCSDGFGDQDYKISVSENECSIYASDSEGARRAVYYLEEELIKHDGPFLTLGDITRTSQIKKRITRGFFSPTNRPPKYGDELLDDIDYYPENYLNRLAHNGTNGIWIYTSFAQLIRSPYLPTNADGCEKRMQKLSGIVERCKRYGIKVYIFAIEPIGLTKDKLDGREDMLGADPVTGYYPFCARAEKTREHVIYCLENIFRSIPDLGGYITIPAGERLTTCASVGTFKTCPRCSKYSRGENLAYSVDLIKEGLRRAGTGAEFISWTYGHRYWDDDDITDYIRNTPTDIVIMQNFEDRGLDTQLGKPRIAYDYWLSYPGPSDMFALSARTAREHGNPAYAKMQVCSSHEIATVPYIPAPGILFDKYKKARELGVTGIMECWYFGNYPSLMNRASTELSYMDDFSDKTAFLIELASRLYGKSRASKVADAWSAFEEGYRNYPTNIMFSYYGPMHDGVVWDLSPIPVNRSLPRSWQLTDPPDGDRIGECLFNGHTIDEAITLSERMCKAWDRGLGLLPLSEGDEHISCAEAIGILFRSGKNILEFYKLRNILGTGADDPYATVEKMENIVKEEMEHSKRMIELCSSDPRLGYHSESEGFKFFPEKLKSRINKLEKLFDGDFATIRKRLNDGKVPLGYYYAEGMDHYPLGKCKDSFRWETIDENRRFGAYVDGDELKIPIRCLPRDVFTLCLEFSLFQPESGIVYNPNAGASRHSEIKTYVTDEGLSLAPEATTHQSFWDDNVKEELSKYRLETEVEDGIAKHVLSVKIPREKWNGKTAIHLSIRICGKPWKTDSDPVNTLGKWDITPGEFGILMPI
ncbi:MAG: hypothetical protein E7648_04205 [Ruminococcaceae bacterium]|nr:hypothetical protein [Oscillospiraceae bacterium]